MIFHRIPVLRALFGGNDDGAIQLGRRWSRAFAATPELAEDLIRLGGLVVQQPVEMVNGWPQPAPLDPHRLAYEAGKRDLALSLLAAGHITIPELNQLMETPDVY